MNPVLAQSIYFNISKNRKTMATNRTNAIPTYEEVIKDMKKEEVKDTQTNENGSAVSE